MNIHEITHAWESSALPDNSARLKVYLETVNTELSEAKANYLKADRDSVKSHYLKEVGLYTLLSEALGERLASIPASEPEIVFSENLKLVSSDTLSSNYLELDKGGVWWIRFWFDFYGQEFVADVESDRIKEDYGSIESEGPSELFDSFNENLREYYWPQLQEAFKKHVERELSELEQEETNSQP